MFKNYLIAKEKFQPDFFLYENNKSAAKAIKNQISYELGVDLMHINSALVSAQNRWRFYAFNWEVEQPEDRGIALKDILETGEPYGASNEKSYALTASYWKGQPTEKVLTKSQRTMVAEPVGVGYRNRREDDGKLYRRFETHCENKSNALTTVQTDYMVAEPINLAPGEKSQTIKAQYYKNSIANFVTNTGGSFGATAVAEPVRIGTIESEAKNQKQHDSKQYRVYSADGKATTLCGQGGGVGAKTGLYAVPVNQKGYKNEIYEVSNGMITIKGKEYPIALSDGYYRIRKLTPIECERLQTMPDGYTEGVSNTQRYKGLGNGWTAEVIIHILQGALKNVPKDEEIIVLSMYDGIGTGRYCLDKMGFTNVKYYAYEIDKYAIQIAQKNYPDIIQMGNAFDLRKEDWRLI